MQNDLLISAENIMDCLNDGVYVCGRCPLHHALEHPVEPALPAVE